MHTTVKKLTLVQDKIKEILNKRQLKTDPKIVVVTKTFSLDKIIPLLEFGHVHFGENRIQESENKWLNVNNKYKKLQLHMIGGLQSNKAKAAVKLFDYIHSLDSEKLASKIAQYEKDISKEDLKQKIKDANKLIAEMKAKTTLI